MRPFAYQRPETKALAIQAATRIDPERLPPVQAPGQFIAGGTNMADYMKLGVMQPDVLVDIGGLAGSGLDRIEVSEEGIRFGGLVRMAQAAGHQEVQRRFPVIADSLKLAASAQIRNLASLGGNVLQRTRCEYFRETSWPCNKRAPGSGCSALDGVNRQHAILGTSEQCIALYHGDLAQALVALDTTVEAEGPNGPRDIPFAELHRRPGETPNVETVLEPGELILAIRVAAAPYAARSRYVKIRDRQSYAFALASAAVALDMDGDRVRDARIALGGIATVPWRSTEAEHALLGKRLDEAAVAAAADLALAGAITREHNAFKLELAKQTLVRALLETRDMTV